MNVHCPAKRMEDRCCQTGDACNRLYESRLCRKPSPANLRVRQICYWRIIETTGGADTAGVSDRMRRYLHAFGRTGKLRMPFAPGQTAGATLQSQSLSSHQSTVPRKVRRKGRDAGLSAGSLAAQSRDNRRYCYALAGKNAGRFAAMSGSMTRVLPGAAAADTMPIQPGSAACQG